MTLTKKWARQDDFDAPLFAAAGAHGVTPTLLKAVCATESAFNSRAYREEAPRPSLPPTPDFPQGGDASFGLMQVLARTARDLGFQGPVSGLFDPATSLNLGAKYLGQQLRRYNGLVPDAVAAYNAGSARRTSQGTYINQAYVDKVLANLDYFRQWEAQKGTVAAGFPVATFPDKWEPGHNTDTQHRAFADSGGAHRRVDPPAMAWQTAVIGGTVGLGVWAAVLLLIGQCNG